MPPYSISFVLGPRREKKTYVFFYHCPWPERKRENVNKQRKSFYFYDIPHLTSASFTKAIVKKKGMKSSSFAVE